jgi:sterol desaturase/sphingolipid hydroxylase (fatty acid hydroxylase superfamily)
MMGQSAAVELRGGGGGAAAVQALRRSGKLVRGRRTAHRVAALAGLAIYGAAMAVGWCVLLRLTPDQVSLHVVGRTLALRDIHHRIVGNALLVFGLLPFALWVEYASVGWERSSIRALVAGRSPSMKTDLAIFVLGQAHVLDVAGRFLMLGASMISGLWLKNWLYARFGVAFDLTALPLVLQVVIYFFVYTFFDYWTHRVDHSYWFWPLHRYHHSAEEFCVLTSGRQHPVSFTSILIINVPLAVLGATPAVMIYVNVIVTGIGFLIHSQMQSDWGFIGRWVIQSPLHHRLHHKLDMSYPTGHFSMSPVWDRLFGTWSGKAEAGLAIGVSTRYRHGAWVVPDLARDYWDFWKSFVVRRVDD